MFRKVKKKPTATMAKQSRDSDEEEPTADRTTGSSLWHKPRRPPRASGVETTTTRTTVTKRPRTHGLGYGGANPTTAAVAATAFQDTESEPNPTSHSTATNITSSSNRYDANSLSQLRQEQTFSQPHNTDPGTLQGNPNEEPSENSARDHHPGAPDHQDIAEAVNVFGFAENANFIPMDEPPDRDTVLAGDDAFAYGTTTGAFPEPPTAERTMESVVRETRPAAPPSTTKLTTTLTLDQVHRQFAQTQERLQQQAAELERSVQRRHQAQQDARLQANQQAQELKATGSSLEFYQSWRRDLISFVGALREITKALPEMQKAWHELEQDMAGIQKWRDWEDDTVAVLSRYNLLQSTAGRQPLLAMDLWDEPVVEEDEFGRDVGSQKRRVLQQRRRERRKIQKDAVVASGIKEKIGISGATTAEGGSMVSPHLNSAYAYPTGYPVLAGPEEMETFRERNKSLQHALKIVLEGLYEEYTSLPQLFELFAQWKRSFPAEYKECYASLTLADLATVLILVELLSLNDPLNESGGHDEAKWITSVCRHYDCSSTTGSSSSSTVPPPDDGTAVKLFDKESIEHLVRKAVLPTLQDLLSEKQTYNLLSARQGKALSTFFLNAKKLLPEDHPILRMLYRIIVDYIKNSLQDLSVPLIVSQSAALERLQQCEDPQEEELLGQTIHDATIGQMERVKKIMLNLLDCWASILPADCGLPSVLLEFMASKVVPLLSAVQTWYWPPLAESPADIFLQLWQVVGTYDWCDRPENLIHSTVLRATAEAFQGKAGAREGKHPGNPLLDDDLASDPILQQAS